MQNKLRPGQGGLSPAHFTTARSSTSVFKIRWRRARAWDSEVHRLCGFVHWAGAKVCGSGSVRGEGGGGGGGGGLQCGAENCPRLMNVSFRIGSGELFVTRFHFPFSNFRAHPSEKNAVLAGNQKTEESKFPLKKLFKINVIYNIINQIFNKKKCLWTGQQSRGLLTVTPKPTSVIQSMLQQGT